MVKAQRRTSPPPFCQSKPLCFSCLYLTATVVVSFYLAVYPSSKCYLILRYSSGIHLPIQTPLFSYPSSYAQHKHSLPTLHSDCSSPVFFSDYWRVYREIDESSREKTSTNVMTRYVENKGRSFGGNLSTHDRFSLFDRLDQTGDNKIPCGFFKPFRVNNHDRIAMENCRGVVVVSAIFGNHDKIRQPRGLGSKTLDLVCFFMFVDDATLSGLKSHNIIPDPDPDDQETKTYSSYDMMIIKLGAWRLVKLVSSDQGLLYSNPAMNGVIPKYLVHRLFPNSKYSIWVDAKLQLAVDPLLLIHSLVVKEDVDMAISKHPFFLHTMEEAMATSRWRKWLDVDGLRLQMETYCHHGLRPWSNSKLPYPSDVPDTALILRKHGESSNTFSCLMFNELDAFNHRDQLAFAFVRDKMRPNKMIKINMFEVEVFEQIVLEYRHNLQQQQQNNIMMKKKKKKEGPSIKRAKPENGSSFSKDQGLGNCKKYFQEMWGHQDR